MFLTRVVGERAELELRRVVPEEGHLEGDAGQQEDHPVGWQDPEGTVAQVAADAGSRYAAHHRGRERPVEEKSRQREEQDHAEREMRHDARQGPESRTAPVGAGEEPAVVHEDAARGDGASALDPGQTGARRWLHGQLRQAAVRTLGGSSHVPPSPRACHHPDWSLCAAIQLHPASPGQPGGAGHGRADAP